MTVALGDAVRCHYKLSCGGHVLVDTSHDAPETLNLGEGHIDPRLEALILGMTTGQHERFELSPEQAFGVRNAELIQGIPRSDLPAGMDFEAGTSMEFTLPNGESLIGHILEVSTSALTVDFNHLLAGQHVVFEISILSIEKKPAHD